jgi:transmembrane sensor
MNPTLSGTTAVEAGRSVEPRWDRERTERNLMRAQQRRAARVVRRRVAGGVGLLAAALVALFVLRRPAPSAPPVEAARAVAPATSAAADPKTTFADGSTARVSDGGELRVEVATEERILSVLTSGAVDFEVKKRDGREFLVDAGPIRVRVIGTKFRVELDGERARVSVSRGRVEVQLADARAFMEAGESRWFPGLEAVAKTEGTGPSPRARFLSLARAGEFADAYQLMTQSPSAVGSSAEELMLAADAARLSGHPEQAIPLLQRVTREHKGDSRAPLAAFTLGRLLQSQLGRPAEAATAFALVARLQPAGGLVEDALGRRAEALAASGASVEARRLASEYLERYPKGKHLPTMQRLASAK